MELETINKLYLELSQITTATTAKELVLEKRIRETAEDARQLCYAIEECECSEAQTRASVKASALADQIRKLV